MLPILKKQVVNVEVNLSGKPQGNIFPTLLYCALEWNINIRPFLFCVSKLCLEVHGEQRAVWGIK